ncbi:MAG TPA: hypothetical protein VER76_12855 [Pyrinomonadaceae bacterium]|nr:hypothetical protein [Pyrinomonadaceae bacterium]
MDKFISTLDAEFAALHARSCALLKLVPAGKLYWQPRAEVDAAATTAAFPVYSCGEHLLRSAASVEQTFGGLTANLWDDPFEWTLPETLSTPALVAGYLAEVEATRRRGLALVKTDDDLLKEIAAPSGEMRALFALLNETLARAAHHQGRAFATFQLFSSARLPLL